LLCIAFVLFYIHSFNLLHPFNTAKILLESHLLFSEQHSINHRWLAFDIPPPNLTFFQQLLAVIVVFRSSVRSFSSINSLFVELVFGSIRLIHIFS